MKLRHGNQESTLEAGDAAYFDAGTAHSYACVGNKPAGAIIVTMHHAPAAQPQALRAGAPGPRSVSAAAKANDGDGRHVSS